MLIDAKNAVLGRLATQVAKKALLGETIDILNCEKILISGKKEVIFAKYDRLSKMGVPRKGPFISSDPEKFVKRIIRGMVPYKQPKGREALARIKLHKGVPKIFEGKETQQVGVTRLRVDSVTIEQVCKFVGGKQ